MFLFPAPGGMPIPIYYIAIWKSGYQAFIFSQCGDINDIKSRTGREDLKKAISEIPYEGKEYNNDDKAKEMFSGGKIKLYHSQR